LNNLALFLVKNANFSPIFSAKNILKNENIGPWSHCFEIARRRENEVKKRGILVSNPMIF
jgi:hypothetical protein